MSNTSALKTEQAEYDAWEHICLDAFDDPKKGIVAVITAYFDESYNHPKAGSSEPAIYTVGCYFALEKDWDKFRKEWRIELGKKGLTSFHMNQFEFARSEVIAGRTLSKKSPYLGWAREDFDPFLRRLHKVIGRKTPSGLSRLTSHQTEVIKADFDEVRPLELQDDPECCSYYMICVVNLMAAIAWWANRNFYTDPIHYVFAGGNKEEGNLGRWFDYCWKHPSIAAHYRLGKGFTRVPHDIQFAAAEPALQAADIAAYEFNKATIKWIGRDYEDMPKDDLRKSLSSLVRAEYRGWLLRKKELEETFAEILSTRRRFPV